MILKLLTCIAGAGWTRNAGELVDIDDKSGTRLIEAGFAEPVKTKAAKPAAAPRTTQAPMPELETRITVEAK